MAKNKDLSSLMRSIKTSVSRTKLSNFSSLDEIHEQYGVKFHIPTNLPNFDIIVGTDPENGGYGLPTGRIVELFGESQTFKSYFINYLGALTLKSGGVVFGMHSEYDVDANFTRQFIEEVNLDYKKVKDRWMSAPVDDIEGLREEMSVIMPKIRELHDKVGDIPVMVFVDSLGALMSRTNSDRYESGEVAQTGSRGSSLHNFFKSILRDVAKYNVLFVYTNHLRANIGGMGRQPASDKVLQWYPSIRVKLSAYRSDVEKSTSMGVTYEYSQGIRVKLYKKRGRKVADNTCTLIHHEGYGFDVIHSLIEACYLTKLADQSSGLMRFPLERDFEDSKLQKIWAEVSEWLLTVEGAKESEVRGVGKVALINEKKFRKSVGEELINFAKLEKLCKAIGPAKLDDRRWG